MNSSTGIPAPLLAAKPAGMPLAEWSSRLELAACYRLFDALGWVELIFNHITLRIPGPDRHFLINPYGLNYNEVTARNLVAIDLDGNRIDTSAHPVNVAGFVIHAAVHRARADAHCVMHTHTTAGMAVACKEGGLRFDNFNSAQMLGRVAYHDFEGITTSLEEQPRIAASLGAHEALILRNHGLLAVGPHIPQAFVTLFCLQRACEIQLAQAALGPCIPVPEAVAHKTTVDSLQFDASFGAGQDVFDALVRQVDRLDDSYKK